MGLSDLFSKVQGVMDNENVKEVAKKIASSDSAKKVVKKIANNKILKSAGKTAQKTIKNVAKSAGLDITKIISLATKNKDIIDVLGKIGLKKETSDPASTAVQKLVGSLKSTVSKAIGVKVEDDMFGNIVNKLLKTDTVKSRVEKIAGSGVSAFIKKAVAEYIS